MSCIGVLTWFAAVWPIRLKLRIPVAYSRRRGEARHALICLARATAAHMQCAPPFATVARFGLGGVWLDFTTGAKGAIDVVAGTCFGDLRTAVGGCAVGGERRNGAAEGKKNGYLCHGWASDSWMSFLFLAVASSHSITHIDTHIPRQVRQDRIGY